MPSVIRREIPQTAAPFSFADVEQEAALMLQAAREQAARIEAAARTGAEARYREHHERGRQEGLEQGRREGIEQIRREAAQAARSEAKSQVESLVAALTESLDLVEQRKHNLLAQAESGLIQLALAVARRVCRRLAEHDPQVAVEQARALLELVEHHHDLELHLHPADAETLRAAAGTLLEHVESLRHVRIVADEQVSRAGCVLHSEAGTIDATIETQLDRIAAALTPQADAPGATASPQIVSPPQDGAAPPQDTSREGQGGP